MQAMDILMRLKGLNLVGMDLVEVAPEHDNGEVTALAGASLMYQMLHVLAESRPNVIEAD
jgi:arginase family enzyme